MPVGIAFLAAEHSLFDASFNTVSADGSAVQVYPWIDQFVPSSPSQYLIHNNKLSVSGQFAWTIYLRDSPGSPFAHVAVYDNTIESKDVTGIGLVAVNTQRVNIWANRLVGQGQTAIGFFGGSQNSVVVNDLSRFTPDPSLGNWQMFFNPDTSRDFVVCARSSDTVLNLGTDNTVLGCHK
jgi:hypothetical protein